MLNGRIMSLKMARLDICDLMLATTIVYIDMDMELHDEHTTESRKKVLRESMKKWECLHDEIGRQINEFDRQFDEESEA